MDEELHLDWIRVPLTWCGFTRKVGDDLVWACGACPDAQVCVDNARCQRATDDDFARATGGRV